MNLPHLISNKKKRIFHISQIFSDIKIEYINDLFPWSDMQNDLRSIRSLDKIDDRNHESRVNYSNRKATPAHESSKFFSDREEGHKDEP